MMISTQNDLLRSSWSQLFMWSHDDQDFYLIKKRPSDELISVPRQRAKGNSPNYDLGWWTQSFPLVSRLEVDLNRYISPLLLLSRTTDCHSKQSIQRQKIAFFECCLSVTQSIHFVLQTINKSHDTSWYHREFQCEIVWNILFVLIRWK